MRVAKTLVRDPKGYTLILRRSDTHPRFALEADLPGGIIERDETYEEGLARELIEETGIVVAPESFTQLAERDSFGFDTKRLYTVTLPSRPDVTISWEHDQYEWVAPDSLTRRLNSRDSFMQFAQKTVAASIL